MAMKEQLEAIGNVVRSTWRFRWSALLVAVLVGLAGTFYALLYPGKYRSQATIYVDTKSVLRPLLQGLAITEQGREDSDVVRGALLARPTLDQVARTAGLYSRTSTPEASETLLTELATLITIHGDSSTGLYTIAYLDYDSRVAWAVVRALLDTFVASSIGAGRSDRQNAEAFLEQQVAEYARRLSDSEQRLADFKKKNLGLMPDQRGDYFARVQAEVAARNKIRTDLAVANQQRDQFVGKIGSASQGITATTAAPTMQQVQAAQALDARIREAHSSLDALLEKYTDRHPQVKSQREMILRLEEQRQAELGQVRITNPIRTEASPVAVDAVVQNLQIALNSVDVQIATLEMQLKHSESQIAELQRTVTVGAEIEAELARLNRDYGVTKAQYEALLQRLESAHISNDADRSDKLRFKILEPPRVALRPVKPNKPLLLAGVLFGAMSLGAGVALLRAQTRSVFFSRAAVSASLNLPVIGTVSKAYSAQERSAQLRGYLAYGIVVSLLVAFVTAAAAFNFPLSQLLRHTIGMEVE